MLSIYAVLYVKITYLRSPSTSGRSFVIAMTSANSVTKDVMKATGALHMPNKKLSITYIYAPLEVG